MGSSQSQFSNEWTAKTTVQTHLPNETFVDIFAFLPNDNIVRNVVFASRRFCEICLPILRKRFDVKFRQKKIKSLKNSRRNGPLEFRIPFWWHSFSLT
jgi:hypothetical protein